MNTCYKKMLANLEQFEKDIEPAIKFMNYLALLRSEGIYPTRKEEETAAQLLENLVKYQ